MEILRTPDECFEQLAGYPFPPHYVEVPDGEGMGGSLRVHYVDEGPRDADPVVFLHGNPTWSYLWRRIIPPVVSAGHRAIALDLVGMGRSDKPSEMKDYTVARHVEWMRAAIVDALELRNVTFVLHDWGGIIGFLAIQREPSLFRSYCSLAVPDMRTMEVGLRRYPSQIRNSWYTLFFRLRGLADVIVRANDFAFIEKLWRDWSPGWEPPAEELASVKQTLAQPGVKRAALGYYRAGFDLRSPAAKQTARLFESQIGVPTLALTGALDGCMDTRLHDIAMSPADFPAGLEVVRVEGAGHFLHQEKPADVSRILSDWLVRKSPAIPD